jgi:hypothetical protein
MAQAAAVILQQVFDAERLDTDHAGSGRMSLVASLCRKSRRRSAMRAWMRATLRLAFSWFLLPFCSLFVPALGTRQALLLLLEEALVARFLPRREGHHVLQSQVNPHGVG